MKVLSLCSSYVNSILDASNIEKIKYDYLPSIIYYEDSINMYRENKDISGKECIKSGYDIVIFDILSFIEEGIEYRGLIYNKKLINIRGRDLDRDKPYVFIEAMQVLMNELLRVYTPEQIFFMDFNNITFNDKEKEEDYNFFYKLYSNNIQIYNILKIESSIHISNEIIISNETKDEIDVKLREIKVDKRAYKGEKVYQNIQNIRYVFEKAKVFNKEKLLIVFSSFSSDIPKYNYINTLKCIDCNKLFILDDYGVKGCYYIGLDGKFDIETSVVSLITNIISENNISFNNITSIGSSKGGSAAIYYGLKYNFGNVVAGAPQYKIGSYLIDLSIKDYAIEIFGGIEPSKRIKYDNLIRKVAKKNQKTNILILTGDGDPQYKKVLKEFEILSEELELNLNIDKCDIENHNEISKVFPKYLLSNVEEILNGKGCIKGNVLLNILNKFN